jgi:glycosyltransferase involved in cell wall biosynthesis
VADTPLRVALDGTPLLGVRTGIGRYVEHLVAELATMPDDIAVRVAAFSLRGRRALRSLPVGVGVAHRPVPARLLHRAWMRGDSPPAEWFTGRADVIHGTNFVLPPPRRSAGVVTVHDLTFLRYPELVDAASLAYRELVPRAVRAAARVLTPTRAVAEEVMEAYRLPAERACVTPLGVDPSWFDAAPARPSGVPEAYVLAVGTVQPRKGLDVLLAAYRALIAEDADVPPLVVAGPPGWGTGLDPTGLPPSRLVMPGYVDAPTLRGLVAGADVLVFPSRYEGFGLPPLEALAAGTRVVASDVPAVREVLGGHARLVPPGDPDALAAALGRVLAEPADGRAVQAARQHARSFTWRRCAELTMAAYRSAVASVV